MPGKILLIVDSLALGDLRAAAELPPAWLRHAPEEDLLSAMEEGPPWVLPVRPGLLVQSEEPAAQRPLDPRSREEVLHAMRGGTVCYLAVLTRESFDHVEQAGQGDVPLPAAEGGAGTSAQGRRRRPTLAEHVTWYRRFRAELIAAAGAHRGQLHQVLILVCCDAPPCRVLEDFQCLVGGDGGAPLFDVCYVMMEDLESGSQVGQVFHAEHVWPIAVGDLLLKLLHDSPAPAADAGRVCAWRTYVLAPDVDPQQRSAICRQRFASLRQLLLEGSGAEPAWDSTPFTRFDPVGESSSAGEPPRPAESGKLARLPWLDYPAPQELARIVAPQRWEHPLTRAAERFAILRSRRVLEADPPAAVEAVKIWRMARQHPSYVGAALADPRLLEGPPLGDQYEAISERWEAIREKDDERRELVDDAGQCAEHFESARHAFLGVGWRFGVVLVVTLFTGYLAMAALHPLAGTWQRAAAAAVAAALGSAAAAFAGMQREDAAGRRARASFEAQLRAIDHNVQERHDACVHAIQSADVFWQQMRASAAAERLEALLRRVQAMLDRELQHPGVEETRTQELASAASPGLPEARLAQQRRQRERYRKVTRLCQLIDVADLGDVADQELDDVVRNWAGDFLEDVWHPLCEHYDKACSGNLPAAALVPEIRGFCERFERSLLAAVRRLALRRMTEWDYGPWVGSIRAIVEGQQYFELMSCRMLSHETADAAQRPQAQLYLREGFDGQRFLSALASGRLAEPVQSPWLEALPFAGFLFQEMPVVFCCEGGVICVGPYRRASDES